MVEKNSYFIKLGARFKCLPTLNIQEFIVCFMAFFVAEQQIFQIGQL